MTMSRFDRFLKLERPRPRRDAPGTGPAASERFAQPSGAVPIAQPSAPSGSGAETDRFAPAAEPEAENRGLAETAANTYRAELPPQTTRDRNDARMRGA